AARIYIDFLLARPQQERAMTYGFRPAEVGIPLASPVDTAHGIDPAEPQTTLEVPSAEVMDAVLRLWDRHKKHANIVLALDTSGRMGEQDKLPNARQGAIDFVDALGDDDTLHVLTFSHELRWAVQGARVGTSRATLHEHLGGLFAEGGTALYDAIDAANTFVRRG